MRATVGDRICVRSHKLGVPERQADVLSVGSDGAPPYQVRWRDSGHEGLFFPGTDAYVEHQHTTSPEPQH